VDGVWGIAAAAGDARALGVLVAGALVGGFVSGLTGFGTGLSALPVWLQGLPAMLASPLVSACSVAAQLRTLATIWPHIPWRKLLPWLLTALAGVPIGTWLLPQIDAVRFKIGVAAILIVYASIMLAADGRLTVGAKPSDRWVEPMIGFAAGILGGIAGLSGALLSCWAAIKGWPKDTRRGLFQGFNLTILAVALAAQFASGIVPAGFFAAVAMALPVTLIGVALGQWLYHRLDDRRFDRVVLVILLAAGIALMASSALAGR
jgi:hypothetical protein